MTGPQRPEETAAAALARLYDLDLSDDPGDLDLYRALAERTGGPIVELAAGSGRVAIPLAAAGHTVVGIDRDPAMLARAWAMADLAGRTVSGRLDFVAADVLELGDARGDPSADPQATWPGALAAGKFKLAILALNSILVLGGARDQRRAIRSMAQLLEPGGLAVVDAWQPDPHELVAFDGRLSLEWLRRDPETGRDVVKLVAAWYDAAARIVTLTTLFDEAAPGESPRRWTRSDALRLMSADELAGAAVEAGLEIERLAGDHQLEPFGPGSERAILIARRPGRAGPS